MYVVWEICRCSGLEVMDDGLLAAVFLKQWVVWEWGAEGIRVIRFRWVGRGFGRWEESVCIVVLEMSQKGFPLFAWFQTVRGSLLRRDGGR